MQAYRSLKGKITDKNPDIQKGIDAVINTLPAPCAQIAANAGFDGADIIEEMKNQKGDYGFDAKTGKWLNMLESGIIDPTKVTKTALLNAASISALFITTEAVVTELPKPAAPVAPAAGGDEGMGY